MCSLFSCCVANQCRCVEEQRRCHSGLISTPLATALPTARAIELLSDGLSLPPPVVGIRVEDEHAAVREGHVEDVSEEDEDDEGHPLEPRRAARPLVVRRERDEREEEH